MSSQGQIIKAMRKRYKISMRMMVEESGVPFSVLGRIENDLTYDPTDKQKVLRVLARYQEAAISEVPDVDAP